MKLYFDTFYSMMGIMVICILLHDYNGIHFILNVKLCANNVESYIDLYFMLSIWNRNVKYIFLYYNHEIV